MTSGGGRGTGGSLARVTWAAIAVLSLYALIQLYANVASILADARNAGDEIETWRVWATEGTSLVGWIVVVALMWRALPYLTPPARSWPVAGVLLALGALLASALHVGIMLALREAIWAVRGLDYIFRDGWAGSPYELRKDVPDYLLFLLVLGALRWFRQRPVAGSAGSVEEAPRMFTAIDGNRRSEIPLAEIDRVEAAGNYVEIHVGQQVLMHRATMQAMENALGDGLFARIHRSRLVRRDAVRQIETMQSGDFEVLLADGNKLRGSRRYRDRLAR